MAGTVTGSKTLATDTTAINGDDLASIIAGIGIGISKAQRELDMASMETQRELMESGNFRYGLTATWYAIPEVTFSLKIEYAISSESGKSEAKGGLADKIRKFVVVSSGGKYDNLYKSEKTEESTLTLKFVPVPPPTRYVAEVPMPNLLGLTETIARNLLNSIEIRSDFQYSGAVLHDGSGIVTGQSILPGSKVSASDVAVIKIGGQKRGA